MNLKNIILLFTLSYPSLTWSQAQESTQSTVAKPSFELAHINHNCVSNTETVSIVVHRTKRDQKIKAPKGLDSDQAWLSAQLKEAQSLFKNIGVCFWFTDHYDLPDSESQMKTRTQRTRLGRKSGRLHKGHIDLFIVNKLVDVDVPDQQIRGVHWRDPKDRKHKRWIILSRIARPKVLAHELGHYFDLPHSKYPKSIMNKTPRTVPPMNERGFVEAEYEIMKKAWTRMKRSKHLVPVSALNALK